MKRVLSVALAIIILSSLIGYSLPKQAVFAATIPTISILSVVPDTSVTIRTSNYPANDTFEVTMGLMGTKGVDGIAVTTIDSGDGGSLDATFSIPPTLRGERQIAIRLESPTSGYFSYNWFWNNLTTQAATPAATTTPSTGTTPTATSGIPTISIVSVVAGQSVTIQSANFPANQTFDVLMNRIGTRGIGGTLVETINSGTGGSFTATYTIPEDLRNLTQIAIRLQSPSGYFSYNWFWNTTGSASTPGTTSTPGATPTPQPPTTGTATPAQTSVVPTITITSVIPDQSVTLQTANFPANQSFEVRMGKMGTRGVGGILVTTIDSGSGGSFSSTFTIPEELRSESQIAIRLESPSSGYFSYNWFWNTGQ